MRRRTLSLLAIGLALVMLGACASSPAPASPAASASPSAAPAASASVAASAEPKFDGEVVIALVAAVSGNNKMVGMYQQNGFKSP